MAKLEQKIIAKFKIQEPICWLHGLTKIAFGRIINYEFNKNYQQIIYRILPDDDQMFTFISENQAHPTRSSLVLSELKYWTEVDAAQSLSTSEAQVKYWTEKFLELNQ